MLLKGASVLTEDKKLCSLDVKTDNGIISELGEGFADSDIIDVSDKYLLPGIVDIHTHGGFGGDFMDATDSSFENAAEFHAQNGTTSVLATSLTSPVEQICHMLEEVRKQMSKPFPKCRILGAHVEGPYLCGFGRSCGDA